ncbi:hypothetical protein B7463_g3487, partial [Scytalidium lignicola]
MSDFVTPVIHVVIHPRFSSSHQVNSLQVSLSIVPLHLKVGDAVVSFPNLLRTTSISLDNDNWKATDDLGDLSIHHEPQESNTSCKWVVQRNTSGGVKISYEARPSTNEALFDQGRATDLKYDQGGLIGSGFSFIPIPPGDGIYRLVVEWNLVDAPKGTRAVWTFGEGPGPVEKIGPASMLNDSVYMVGPINSNPATKTARTSSAYYGYYWFGNLPPNIGVIKDIHEAFLLKVSQFFNDILSSDNPYRHFVRNTLHSKSFGGTSFIRSHIFDYDDQIGQVQDYDLVRRMAYEMVHNFLGPSVINPKIDWLFEGIKHTLSIYLPFRPPNQFRTGHYFQDTISMLCMKYYTSPYLQLPQNELLTLASKNDAYAIEHLGTRAWAFVIGTDFAARKLVEKTKPPQRPIEDLAIKPLAVKKKDGKSHGINEWIKLLTSLMGNDVRERYEYMCSGNVILLPVEVFGAKSHQLVQLDQEILDLGMDRQAFEEGLVKSLKKGSRAEEAGLKEGDKITWSSHIWKCAEDFTAKLKVVVNREEKDLSVTFWPRSYEKVKSWQMVKVEDT